MRVIYNLGILFYSAVARLAVPFSDKARLWVRGQKEWRHILAGSLKPDERYIWIHCASLGEFEQGRPLIEALKKEKPWYKIVLTFFSPSGYEVRKNYSLADVVCYLPADTPSNAREFIGMLKPDKVIIVKYEFWNNFISGISSRKIPLFLISGIFRKEQLFFKWYGGFFRQMLRKFTRIYVQDEESYRLLKYLGLENITIAGDTRFDRVLKITSEAKTIPRIEKFRGNEKLFLAGSSWRPDEEIISRYIDRNAGLMKWVFAPHEVDTENVIRLEKLLGDRCVRFSEFTDEKADARVMIIDNMGMLSSAYRYAYIAVVGGGFGKGIHNVLEPASWGIPVLFGPDHKRFREAVELLDRGGAGTFKNYDEFEAVVNRWLSDGDQYKKASESAAKYVQENSGATAMIMGEIE